MSSCDNVEVGICYAVGVPEAKITVNGLGNATGAAECRRGPGVSAVWVARNRFAVLDKTNNILIKDLKNEVTKKIAPPHGGSDMLFAAGTGQLLIRADDTLSLFDLQQVCTALALVSITMCFLDRSSS